MGEKLKKKLHFLWEDASDLIARLVVLLQQGWSLGIDIAKLGLQVVTIWELLWDTKLAKRLGKLLSKLKF